MLDVRALATIAGVVLFATSAQADDSEFDLRGALAVGTGWSGPFKSSALIGGFHDQLRVKSLRPWLGLELSTGLSFVAAPPVAGSPANTPLRGFTSFNLGVGLSFRSTKGGALVVTTATVGMLFDSPNDNVEVIGFGMALTTDVYPLYLTIEEAARCEKGAAYTYIGSGLFLWSSLRDDIFGGANAPSAAVGFGVDIGRAMLLPIIALALRQGCSKKV